MKNKLIALLLAIMVLFTGNLSTFAVGTQHEVSTQTVNRINYKAVGLWVLASAGIAAISAFLGFGFGLRHDRVTMDNKQIGFVGPPLVPNNLELGGRNELQAREYISYIFNNEIPKLHSTDKFSAMHVAAIEVLTRFTASTLSKLQSSEPERITLEDQMRTISSVWNQILREPDQPILVKYLKDLLLRTDNIMAKTAKFFDNWKAGQANITT